MPSVVWISLRTQALRTLLGKLNMRKLESPEAVREGNRTLSDICLTHQIVRILFHEHCYFKDSLIFVQTTIGKCFMCGHCRVVFHDVLNVCHKVDVLTNQK